MTKDILNKMKGDVTGGRITRREFIQYASALGISATAAGSMMTSAFAATPQQGGSATVALSSSQTTDSMDPTRYLTSGDYIRSFPVYNPLVAIDRKLNPIPALATSWEPTSPTGDAWRFELRKGVTFGNGKDLTSADVIYSLSRHIAPDSESPGKPLLQQVTEMKADGDHAVQFKLAAPNAELPMLLTQPQFMITQDGIDDFTDAVANAQGTGAYKLSSFKPGVSATLERRNDSWAEAHIDHYDILVVLDGTARVNGLVSGELDLVNDVDRTVLELVKGQPQLRLVAHKTGAHLNTCMACDRPPFDNLDLRLALKYLIPREQIRDNVFKGYGMIGNDTQVPPTDPFYCHDIPQRPYDVDRAKFHLKKAGVNKVQLHASTASGAGSTESALVYSEAAKPAGLDLEVISAPADSYWSAVWMTVPFCISGWNPRPTADLMLSIANVSTAPWNESFWKNERFDKLLVLARGELDQAKRQAMYCEAMGLLHEDGGVGMLGFYNYIDGANDTIQGYEGHPNGFMRNAFMLSELWKA